MTYRMRTMDVVLALLIIVFLNANALGEICVSGHTDGSFVESMYGEATDELRYLSKIREAAEGKWLIANPYLKEYRYEGFSPSGFVEWIPAGVLRLFGWNWGWMMLFTDLLFSALTVILTRLWLGRLIEHRWIVWTCMFALFFTATMGGSLGGLLRDVAPKFVQPLISLYALLLVLPSRNTLRHTMMRGALIGLMYYTYPYHWTFALVTEAVFHMHLLVQHLITITGASSLQKSISSLRFALPRAAAALLPLIIIAAPVIIAMGRMLSRPAFHDFYDRYHIVYTHIPAAPRLQLILVVALCIGACAFWVVAKQRRTSFVRVANAHWPLVWPIIGMLILLNSNVLTGKDPELLGHGGRVIMPFITTLYAVVIWLLLPKRLEKSLPIAACIIAIGLTGVQSFTHWNTFHTAYAAWPQTSEYQLLTWLDEQLPPEQVIAAPGVIAEKLTVVTSHYVYFGPGAHFFFVPLEELTDRYLGWVGLYPWEQQPPATTATLIIFGNQPGAQWSKERTVSALLGKPFTKTMGDYIKRQDLRNIIDAEHAHPDATKTMERLKTYNVDIVIVKNNVPDIALLEGFKHRRTIGEYEIWQRSAAAGNRSF